MSDQLLETGLAFYYKWLLPDSLWLFSLLLANYHKPRLVFFGYAHCNLDVSGTILPDTSIHLVRKGIPHDWTRYHARDRNSP